MTSPASLSSLDPQFNGFLLAPIAEDRHGITLSVLSALARRDVDPWEEAATLASMPGETAVSRLANLIAPLPDGPAASLDPTAIASRLIALLPSHSSSEAGLRAKVTAFRNGWWPIIAMTLMLLVLGALVFLASRQPPNLVPEHATTPASKASPPSPAQTASYSQAGGIG